MKKPKKTKKSAPACRPSSTKNQPIAPHGLPKKQKKPQKGEQNKAALPPHFVLTDVAVSITKILYEEGVAVLEWHARLSLPREKKGDKGVARIRDFYLSLLRSADEFVHTHLLEQEARAYRADPDPRKRFRRARLRLTLDCEELDTSNGCFAARRRVCLSRGSKTLYAHEGSELFSLKSGRILPPQNKKQAKREQKKNLRNS